MKWKQDVLCLAYLLTLCLTFMLGIPVTFAPPSPSPLPPCSWRSPFCHLLDYGSYGYFTFYSVPQVFWDGAEWRSLRFEDYAVSDGFYLLENAHITAYVYEWYTVFRTPDSLHVCVDDERWIVQVYNEKTGKWREVDLYNPSLAYTQNATHLTVTRTFDCPDAIFKVKYIVAEASPLKHDVSFQSKMDGLKTFRAVMKLSGIRDNTVHHSTGTTQITDEQHLLTPYFYVGNNRTSLVLSEYLDGLGPMLKDVVFNTHAQGCKADIIIGNYALEWGQTFSIDPSTSTFYSSSSDGRVYKSDAVYNTCHGAISGDAVSDSTTTMVIGQYESLEPLFYIHRGFFFFDTSTLAGTTISDAVLGLYGSTDNSDVDFNVTIQNGQPTYPRDPLVVGDYSKLLYSGNGGYFDTSGFSTSAYNNITLNADGRSWINKTNTTKLCVRGSTDINRDAPTFPNDENVFIWTSEKGSGYQPFLKVTYVGAYDYVDNNTSEMDESPDVGTHSDFENEKKCDGTHDTLTEADTNATTEDDTQNFVDNNTSEMDEVDDKGTHSNFTTQQSYDAIYDTLTEENTGGDPEYEWLDCDALGDEYLDWTEVGADPYLDAQDQPTNYIYTTSSDVWEGWFDFPSTTLTGTLSVNMTVYSNNDDGIGDDYADVYVDYTGSGEGSDVGDVGQHTDWQYDDIDLGSHSVSEVNNLRVRFQYIKVGGADDVRIDHVRVGVASEGGDNYELDLEVQWSTLDYDEGNEYLCLNMGTTDDEDLLVDVWNTTTSDWDNLFSDLTPSTWNNLSVTSYLTSTNLTIRFKGGSESSDTNQDSWQIECSLIHVWTEVDNYELDLEIQWTDAPYNYTNEELCFKTGTTDTEDLEVYVRHASSWTKVFDDLSPNAWNNVSVTDYLNASVFTVRFLDANKTDDTNQDAWQIDCAVLHVWNVYKSFDLNVLFLNQSGVADANVTMTDSTETVLFNVTTDANGDIATQSMLFNNNPHTLKIFKKGIRLYKSTFNMTEDTTFIITVNKRDWVYGTTGITFRKSVMPHVKLSYANYNFYVIYKRWYVALRPFVIYNGEVYRMPEIVEYLKTHGVSYEWALRKARNVLHYGFNVSGIPPHIASNLDYIGFKLIDYNFPLSRFTKTVQNRHNATITVLSITNLKFSFQDLQERGYTLQFVNSTYILIGNVRNQTFLDIDPMLYDDNTVTIIGDDTDYYDEDHGCSFRDVCDVNDEQGWGVVDAWTDHQYYVNATTFQIGDGINQTWFVDKNIQVLWGNGGSLQNVFSVKDNGHLVLGTLVNATTKVTKNGCHIVTDGYSYFTDSGDTDNVDVQLYDTHITDVSVNPVTGYGNLDTWTVCNATYYGCVFNDMHSLDVAEDSNIDIWDCRLVNCTDLYVEDTATFERVTVMAGYRILNIYTVAPFTVIGLYGRNAENVSFYRSDITSHGVYLVDADVDEWSFMFPTEYVIGEVYRQYTFNLQVLFENGTTIENANVTMTNRYLDTTDSWLTSATGQIDEQVYSMGHYNYTGGNSLYDYNPYLLTVTYGDYQTYTANLTIDEPLDLIVALSPACPEAEAPLSGGALRVLVQTDDVDAYLTTLPIVQASIGDLLTNNLTVQYAFNVWNKTPKRMNATFDVWVTEGNYEGVTIYEKTMWRYIEPQVNTTLYDQFTIKIADSVGKAFGGLRTPKILHVRLHYESSMGRVYSEDLVAPISVNTTKAVVSFVGIILLAIVFVVAIIIYRKHIKASTESLSP